MRLPNLISKHGNVALKYNPMKPTLCSICLIGIFIFIYQANTIVSITFLSVFDAYTTTAREWVKNKHASEKRKTLRLGIAIIVFSVISQYVEW